LYGIDELLNEQMIWRCRLTRRSHESRRVSTTPKGIRRHAWTGDKRLRWT
jgi:hypothetical protein